MAFFFKNKCQYKNCGQEFPSLAALIRHVEQVHIFIKEDDVIVRDRMQMVPMSMVSPSNIEDVLMPPPVNRGSSVPMIETTMGPSRITAADDGTATAMQSITSAANKNAQSTLEATSALVNYNSCAPSLQSMTAGDENGKTTELISSKMETHISVPPLVTTTAASHNINTMLNQSMASDDNIGELMAMMSLLLGTDIDEQAPPIATSATNHNNCVKPVKSVIAAANDDVIPTLSSNFSLDTSAAKPNRQTKAVATKSAPSNQLEFTNNNDAKKYETPPAPIQFQTGNDTFANSTIETADNNALTSLQTKTDVNNTISSSSGASSIKAITSSSLSTDSLDTGPSTSGINVRSTPPITTPVFSKNDAKHIAESGLTFDEIIKCSVLMADQSKPKPYPCPIAGCTKRYKTLNGMIYHAKSYERELQNSSTRV